MSENTFRVLVVTGIVAALHLAALAISKMRGEEGHVSARAHLIADDFNQTVKSALAMK